MCFRGSNWDERVRLVLNILLCFSLRSLSSFFIPFFLVHFLCFLLMVFNTGSRLLADIKIWVTRKANYARRVSQRGLLPPGGRDALLQAEIGKTPLKF